MSVMGASSMQALLLIVWTGHIGIEGSLQLKLVVYCCITILALFFILFFMS